MDAHRAGDARLGRADTGGCHAHDEMTAAALTYLRHTGNQLAANAGATTRELMHRMGHGSMRAALIYQHATTDRDRAIADALGAMVSARRSEPNLERMDSASDGADGMHPVAQQHADSTRTNESRSQDH